MDNSDNNAWVFDSLVGFLHGPVWNVPLQTFIEEKSLPFEPTDSGEVLDRPEYKKIHDEYRNLVDVMLGSFMDDIGITADQFEAACRLSARDLAGLPAHFHRRLFEQIWAANDYEMFVKMMTHKNVELQLQALELIERRFGTMPSIFSADPEDLDSSRSDESEDWPDNDDVMTEIKKLQIDEIEGQDEVVAVPPEEMVAEKQTLLSKLHSFEKKDELLDKKQLSPEAVVKPTVIEPPKPPPKKAQVSEEEVRARQEYLKQQRDKLLALKKQVREKRLDAADTGLESGGGEGSKGSVGRPRSAKVAQAALKGTPPPPPPDAMQLRRALASKLKTEVVESNH
ncbi:cilia- and flagella-associated protein 36 isoform X2 [Pectinophora gossypiella]|uniref:cilia- and flagella-associated protein 36 isoform X2 n=1 Tax=Pectinophora gossypiella TaxID=13191 RepID=UPI00214E7210|nr:cilia- and flagella-associated protein 36 isoform X2 [Pectinophora gossypiella]